MSPAKISTTSSDDCDVIYEKITSTNHRRTQSVVENCEQSNIMSCSYQAKEITDCMCKFTRSENPNYAAEELSLFLKLQSEIMQSPADMKVSLDESIDLGIEILGDDNPTVDCKNPEKDKDSTDCEVLWVKYADTLKPSGDQSPKGFHVIKHSEVHPQRKTTPNSRGFSNDRTEKLELNSSSLSSSICDITNYLEQPNTEGPKLGDPKNEKNTLSHNCVIGQISLSTNCEMNVDLPEHVNVTKSNSAIHKKSITAQEKLVHRVRKKLGKNKHKKRLNCGTCRKAFSTRTDLLWHINITHADDRPYQCQLCFKNYKRQTHLTRHELVHYKYT